MDGERRKTGRAFRSVVGRDVVAVVTVERAAGRRRRQGTQGDGDLMAKSADDIELLEHIVGVFEEEADRREGTPFAAALRKWAARRRRLADALRLGQLDLFD
jgi:hypothetical protein